MKYDLHLHSTASDGSLTPTELVKLCKSCDLSVMALTDHDNVSGIKEGLEEAKRQGIEFIPGVELSAKYQGELHILGLGIDWQSKELHDFLNLQQERREVRSKKLLDKLQQAGIAIEEKDVRTGTQEISSRTHFAIALVKLGIVKDVDEAFKRYLNIGARCYVPREKASLESCVEVIKATGGMAVWAHPYKMGLPDYQMEALGQRLKELGVKGLEAYYPRNGVNAARKMVALAERLDMVPTYGSDFHSKDRGIPGREFYEFDIPENIYRIIKEFNLTK